MTQGLFIGFIAPLTFRNVGAEKGDLEFVCKMHIIKIPILNFLQRCFYLRMGACVIISCDIITQTQNSTEKKVLGEM